MSDYVRRATAVRRVGHFMLVDLECGHSRSFLWNGVVKVGHDVHCVDCERKDIEGGANEHTDKADRGGAGGAAA